MSATSALNLLVYVIVVIIVIVVLVWVLQKFLFVVLPFQYSQPNFVGTVFTEEIPHGQSTTGAYTSNLFHGVHLTPNLHDVSGFCMQDTIVCSQA
jgi:hypothetical protein